ncbi:nucleoid occlusion factor SlmA [Paracidovorax wautersii]|uniref:Transcriptional regulator, TetR family n=1 Tax=Paracidovorax wautersii TaxID=1177982 RepID=A0A1I2C4C6_9BURK|nr:nucleoid occlusion factor SlmA [Paracidovorax wautersii]SFE63169.1 transcriptional regulator, TetR family [Paracidovorax wautersii]
MPDIPNDSAAFDGAATESAAPAGVDEAASPAAAPAGARRRPKPGERRLQILQALAGMLEQPGAERITTAALAARLDVSEAALYRHFASKAQMFEGLIDFIEESIFTRVQQITQGLQVPVPAGAGSGEAAPGEEGAQCAARICALVLQFGARNPGMVRVMVGDALVLENDRLLQRMNQFFDRIESSLRQCLRPAADAAGSATPTAEAQVRAAALCDLLRGRLQRYARTDFRRSPVEQLEATLQLWLGPLHAASAR